MIESFLSQPTDQTYECDKTLGVRTTSLGMCMSVLTSGDAACTTEPTTCTASA